MFTAEESLRQPTKTTGKQPQNESLCLGESTWQTELGLTGTGQPLKLNSLQKSLEKQAQIWLADSEQVNLADLARSDGVLASTSDPTRSGKYDFPFYTVLTISIPYFINANAHTLKPHLTKSEIITACLKTPCPNLADLLRFKRRYVPQKDHYNTDGW